MTLPTSWERRLGGGRLSQPIRATGPLLARFWTPSLETILLVEGRELVMERTKPAHVWPWVGLAALAGMTLALPLAWLRRRRHPPTREHEWMEAYVRGCLADDRR